MARPPPLYYYDHHHPQHQQHHLEPAGSFVSNGHHASTSTSSTSALPVASATTMTASPVPPLFSATRSGFQDAALVGNSELAVSSSSTPTAAMSSSGLASNYGQTVSARNGQPRKIASAACQACRRKRARCLIDIHELICKNCQQSGAECIFGTDKRKERRREHDVKARIEDLLAQVQCSDGELVDLLKELRDRQQPPASAADTSASQYIDEHNPPPRPTATPTTSSSSGNTNSNSGGQVPTVSDIPPSLRNAVHREAQMSPAAAGPRARPRKRRTSDVHTPDTAGSHRHTSSKSDSENQAIFGLSGTLDTLSLDSDGAVRAIPGLSTFGLTAQSPSEQLTNPTSLPSKQQSMVQMQPPSDTVDKGPITEYDILYAAAREAAALPMGTDVRVVSHLIYLFFLWLNSIYPIASRKIFYEHLRDNGPLCSPFLLNSILAAASHLCEWPVTRADPSNVRTTGCHFFARARALMQAEVDSPCLTSVQGLALMAKHCLSAGRGYQAGIYWVICTRIANDLGLHLDPMPLIASRRLTQEEAYVRCITFWGIWTLDKEFGALLGRPCVFRDMVITCPRPAYWRSEDFDWRSSFNAGRIIDLSPSQTRADGVFDYAIGSWDAAAAWTKSMSDIYWTDHRGFVKPDDVISSLNKHFNSARNMIAALPPVDHPDVIPALITIHQFFHCHLIIMNRPFMFTRTFGEAPIAISRDRCMASAREIIRLTGLFRQSSSYGLRGTINGHLHCIVIATAILLHESWSVLQNTPPSPTIPQAKAEDQHRARVAHATLLEAMQYLEEMSEYRPSAEQAVANIRSAIAKSKAANIPVAHAVPQSPIGPPIRIPTVEMPLLPNMPMRDLQQGVQVQMEPMPPNLWSIEGQPYVTQMHPATGMSNMPNDPSVSMNGMVSADVYGLKSWAVPQESPWSAPIDTVPLAAITNPHLNTMHMQ